MINRNIIIWEFDYVFRDNLMFYVCVPTCILEDYRLAFENKIFGFDVITSMKVFTMQ